MQSHSLLNSENETRTCGCNSIINVMIYKFLFTEAKYYKEKNKRFTLDATAISSIIARCLLSATYAVSTVIDALC